MPSGEIFSISDADDGFHHGDDVWHTETSWFSFNVPERQLGCWLYGWVRPNMRNAGGGAFVWDGSAVEPWNLPYFNYQYTQPLPEPRDLRHFTFPNGYSIEMLEPLKRYHLTYRDRDHLVLDLEFTALCDPHPFAHGEPPFLTSGHFDQPGHIVGEMIMKGERVPIDSYSVRDRSWGPRLDHKGNRIGYPFGVAADRAFCCFAIPRISGDAGPETINHGFYWADNRRLHLKSGTRTVDRHSVENWVTRININAIDVEGRALVAEGVAESRMFLSVPRGVTINSSMRWTINGAAGYGEDQDVWRYDQWRDARRKTR